MNDGGFNPRWVVQNPPCPTSWLEPGQPGGGLCNTEKEAVTGRGALFGVATSNACGKVGPAVGVASHMRGPAPTPGP